MKGASRAKAEASQSGWKGGKPVFSGPPPGGLTFYEDAPYEEITLDDFELLAFDRLKRACCRVAGTRPA